MPDKKALTERIRAYQFALYDLALFQDTHPNEEDANQLRKIYQKKLTELMDAYEGAYGEWITTHNDLTANAIPWKEWVENPWPWDNDTKEGK